MFTSLMLPIALAAIRVHISIFVSTCTPQDRNKYYAHRVPKPIQYIYCHSPRETLNTTTRLIATGPSYGRTTASSQSLFAGSMAPSPFPKLISHFSPPEERKASPFPART
jgi:hypothetical protein